jgi:hypothetical protein
VTVLTSTDFALKYENGKGMGDGTTAGGGASINAAGAGATSGKQFFFIFFIS